MLKRSSSSYTNHFYPPSGAVCGANRIRPVSYLQYSSSFQRPVYPPSSNVSQVPKPSTYLRPNTPKIPNPVPKQSYNPYSSSSQIRTINEKREEIDQYKKVEAPFLKKNNISQLLSSLKKEIIEISENIRETDEKVNDYYYKRNYSVGRSRPITPSKGISTPLLNKTNYDNKSGMFGSNTNISRDYSPYERNDRTIFTYQYKQNENEAQNEKMNRLISTNDSLERQVISLQQKLNSTNKAIPELLEKNNRLEQENEDLKVKYNDLDKEYVDTRTMLMNEIELMKKGNVLRSKGNKRMENIETNGKASDTEESLRKENEKLSNVIKNTQKEIEQLNMQMKEQEELVNKYMKINESAKKEIEELTIERNTMRENTKEENKQKDSMIEQLNNDIILIKRENDKEIQRLNEMLNNKEKELQEINESSNS